MDPLTSKYEIVSPYNYAYNNPILFVDPTGRENTIYLMVAGKMRSTEVTRIINSANAFLNKLGLKTQVKLFEGKNFDTRNLDKTDNFAVIGYDRRAVAEKVRSITGDHFADHADRWASKDGDKYNPEVANGIINGMGIAVDHSSAGNIGTQDGNSNPDSAGGSAITLIHAGAHSSWVIQGKYGKVGKGDKEGHTAAGVAANGNKLVESFNRGGADEVLKQDNSAYIEAMMQRYGTKEAEDNYEKNRRARNK